MNAVTWLERTASTQDEVHRLAAAGAPHGTAVAAKVQSEGRGTRGRTWVSREGGLWLSMVCRPEQGTAVEVLGIRVGLALAELLDALVRPPARISLKWPNDLLLGSAKIGGILAEARWQGDKLSWIALGLGLNLRNVVPPGGARLLEAGVMSHPEELAEPVAHQMAEAARTAAPLNAAELSAFALRDWLKGRTVRAPEQGIAEGISPGGLLRVRTSDGRLTEVVGSVELGLGASA